MVQANQERLLQLGKVMLNCLLTNIQDCAPEFFFVAQIMQIEILSKFPEKPEFRHQV